MSREIPLTRGFIALVDDSDYEELMKFKWYATTNYKTKITYAARGIRTHLPEGKVTTVLVFMHNQIMGKNEGLRVDHISRDALDNRRMNLRWATKSQNAINTNRKVGKTGFYGVYERRYRGETHGYQVTMLHEGRKLNVGYFSDKIDAAKAHDAFAIKHRGEFARLNFPEPVTIQGGN